MANPNLKNLTSVYLKTATLSLTTTASAILENAVSSGKSLKISSVIVSNVSSDPKTYTYGFIGFDFLIQDLDELYFIFS